MKTKKRRYPVGIQTFSEIIRGGYIYVDKTDLVWKLQDYSKYVFLSRPRRFGKSLLSTTLHSFFDGDRKLFEGLKIMHYESEWHQFPVIHLDLSLAKGQESAAALQARLMLMLKDYAELYGKDDDETTPGSMLEGLIKRAYQQKGEQVVIILDEYDAPLLEVLHEEENIPGFRKVMQEFYQPLKACEAMVRFCFITGITKFSQLSIFSTLNNLTNVTLDPNFATICGITEQELTTVMKEDVKMLGDAYEETPEQMHQRLKLQYDGYHFSENSEGVYNPYSLLKSFQQRKISPYWFESGTPTFLIRQMLHFHTDITSLEGLEVPSSAFDRPTEAMVDALPLLYQTGYLTIKGYDREAEVFTLDIPNQEVRVGYAEGLLPTYVGLNGGYVQAGFALKFWRALRNANIELALQELQAYIASLPYIEGFKKKLADVATAEGFYEWTFYLIFSMLNVYVRTQVKTIRGRADIVVHMPDAIYVMELKINGRAEEAIEQIESKGYAIPYATDGREVKKVGIRFSTETLNIENWIIRC